MKMEIGINQGGGADYYSGNLIFSNLMTQAMPFQNSTNIPLRPDGYPIRTGDDGNVLTSIGGNFDLPSGAYKLTAEGKGTIIIGENFFSHGPQGWRAFTFDGSKNTYTLNSVGMTPTSGGFQLIITSSDVESPIHNIEITIPGASNKHRFNPRFLSNIQPYSHFRFTDWLSYNSAVGKWSERNTTAFNITQRGMIDWETIFELCNLTRKGCWINLPFNADDDYLQNLAALVDEKLDADLPLYTEYSNEIWNWGFWTAQYVFEEFKKSGEGYIYNYRGKIAGRALNKFRDALRTKNRCKRVIAQQTWLHTIEEAIKGLKEENLDFDAIACAPYFSYAMTPERLIAVNKQYKKGQKAEAITKILTSAHDSISYYIDVTKQYKQVADSVGKPLYLYECGQHLADNDDAFTELFLDCNRDVRMGSSLYTRYIKELESVGVEKATFYNECSAYSRYGSWGLREYTSQPESQTPKLRVVKREALARNPK